MNGPHAASLNARAACPRDGTRNGRDWCWFTPAPGVNAARPSCAAQMPSQRLADRSGRPEPRSDKGHRKGSHNASVYPNRGYVNTQNSAKTQPLCLQTVANACSSARPGRDRRHPTQRAEEGPQERHGNQQKRPRRDNEPPLPEEAQPKTPDALALALVKIVRTDGFLRPTFNTTAGSRPCMCDVVCQAHTRQVYVDKASIGCTGPAPKAGRGRQTVAGRGGIHVYRDGLAGFVTCDGGVLRRAQDRQERRLRATVVTRRRWVSDSGR